MSDYEPTTFILSLDCEGKWGVADRLTKRQHRWLTDDRLRDAYRNLIALLDEFDFPATFAFVGLFAEPESSFRRLVPAIEDLRARAPSYLGPALEDSTTGSCQGWHGHWALDLVGGAKVRHEIGLHGITHVPWTWCDRAFFVDELRLLPELTTAVAQARTFVYPRNEVAHVDLLACAGLKGFRNGRPHKSRLHSLLSELNLWSKAEPGPRNGKPPIGLPAGHFVNWRSGARRLISARITQARFERMVDGSDGGIVHAWLHPENIASAPETMAVLRKIVRSVAERRNRGRCAVLTQIDYLRTTAELQASA